MSITKIVNANIENLGQSRIAALKDNPEGRAFWESVGFALPDLAHMMTRKL